MLQGKNADEKQAWLRQHGRVTAYDLPSWSPREVYGFESYVGLECSFFIDGDKFVFIGDNTLYTGKEFPRETAAAGRKSWWRFGRKRK